MRQKSPEFRTCDGCLSYVLRVSIDQSINICIYIYTQTHTYMYMICTYNHIYIMIILCIYIYIYIYNTSTYINLHANIHAFFSKRHFMSLLEQQLQKALPKEDLDAVKSSYDSVASLLARNCRYLHENLADFVPQQKEKTREPNGKL